MERPAPSVPSVGAFLGRAGTFFLKRGRDVKEIFSFSEPMVTITQEHIMARKPPSEVFSEHPDDKGTLEDAQELSFTDFAKLATTREDFNIPATLRRRDVARVLEECSPPPMLKEALSLLQLRGRKRPQAGTLGARTQEGEAYTPEGELLIGLASLQLEPTAAPVRGDKSQFKVIPRVTRRQAARQAEEARTAQDAAQQEEDPPPAQEQPPLEEPTLQPQGQQGPPEETAPPGDPPPAPTATPEVEDPDVSMPDVEGPELPTAAEEEDPGPTVYKGHSEQLEMMENILRNPSKLAASQQEDLLLGPIRTALQKGSGEDGEYVLDDQNLFFHAPRGKLHVIALPRKLVPGVLALAHGRYCRRKHYWYCCEPGTTAVAIT